MPHEQSVWNREAGVCHREAGIFGRDIPRQMTTVAKACVSKANSETQESHSMGLSLGRKREDGVRRIKGAELEGSVGWLRS